MKKIPAVLFLLSVAFLSPAQNYSGSRKFDGVHTSEYSAYLMGGYNVVTGTFVGEAVSYTRHLSDRWSASVGEQVQFLKQLYSFDVMGTYRLPVGKSDIFLTGDSCSTGTTVGE